MQYIGAIAVRKLLRCMYFEFLSRDSVCNIRQGGGGQRFQLRREHLFFNKTQSSMRISTFAAMSLGSFPAPLLAVHVFGWA